MTPPTSQRALVIIVLACAAAPSAAHAYIDPGSGSYLLQIVIAGLVAVSFTVKTFWSNLKGLFMSFGGRRGSGSSHDD